MNTRSLPLLALALLPLTLTGLACGGGGGGEDPTAPVSQVFPLSGAVTDATTVTVSGRSSVTGLEGVRVAGVPATSTDAFETWSAEVPLAAGSNTLPIELEDADGNVTQVDQVVVRRRSLLRRPDGIDMDPVRGVAWMVDAQGNTLFALDPGDGDLEPLSGPNDGGGQLFTVPFDVAAVPGTSTVYVADSARQTIFRVDTATGDRTELVPSGDAFTFIGGDGGMDFDPVSGLLYVAARNGFFEFDPAQASSKRVIAAESGQFKMGFLDVVVDEVTGDVFVIQENRVEQYDPGTGQLTTLVTGTTSQYTELLGADTLALDPSTGILYVLSGRQVLQLDPSTFEPTRTVAFDLPSLPRGTAFDSTNDRLLVTDVVTDTVWVAGKEPGSTAEVLATSRLGGGALVRSVEDLELHGGELYYLETSTYSVGSVDLATGSRRMVSGDDRGAGLEFEDVYGFTVDPARGRAFVADFGDNVLNLILEVDLATGDRAILAEGDAQTGYAFPLDVDLLPDGKLLILDTQLDGVVEMDPDSGLQRTITARGDGKGPAFKSSLLSMAPAPTEGLVFVADRQSGVSSIQAVQLDSGVRTLIADTGVGQGEVIGWPDAMAFDPESRRLFVLDISNRQIVAIDLDTLDRTLVASTDRGTGPPLQNVDSLAFDAGRNQLFTYSGLDDAILAVSPTSGDRVLVAK